MDRTSSRHQFRADWHDYERGTYFITICTYNKKHLFGEIKSEEMILSTLGTIVDEYIKDIPCHYPDTELCNYVVMPNHVHLVISVGVRARYIAPTHARGDFKPNIGCLKPPKHGNQCENFHHNTRLACIIGTFKAAVTRQMRARCIAPLHITHVWQRLFHDHYIRDSKSFDLIMTYVDNNIYNWESDRFYKSRSS